MVPKQIRQLGRWNNDGGECAVRRDPQVHIRRLMGQQGLSAGLRRQAGVCSREQHIDPLSRVLQAHLERCDTRTRELDLRVWDERHNDDPRFPSPARLQAGPATLESPPNELMSDFPRGIQEHDERSINGAAQRVGYTMS